MGVSLSKKAESARPVRATINYKAWLLDRGGDILLLVIIALMLLPIIFLIVGSFKSREEFAVGSNFFPEVWHFENYNEMWTRVKFGTYFSNSLIICGITTLVVTILASMSGYALARFRFPGAGGLSMAILGTQLVPGTLFLIPLYMTFLWMKNNLGIPLIGTNFGAIVLYVGFFLPISLWIQRSFFATIPIDLEEQAMVDGATRFQAFVYIVMPLAGPGVISTAIFVFLTAWDELLFAWVLNVQTIPVGIRQFTGVAGSQNRYELLSAASVVIILPVAAMFFLLQKRFIAGLTAGAVK